MRKLAVRLSLISVLFLMGADAQNCGQNAGPPVPNTAPQPGPEPQPPYQSNNSNPNSCQTSQSSDINDPGYPYASSPSCAPECQDNCVSECGPDNEDQWGFYDRECTSFTAWKMNNLGVAFRDDMYNDGRKWGNASNWYNAAINYGFKVDKTPTINSIAWWSVGHVAVVSEVRCDGSIYVEEYNYQFAGTYNNRTIQASSVDYFIHVAN